jgi:hypothetical protein
MTGSSRARAYDTNFPDLRPIPNSRHPELVSGSTRPSAEAAENGILKPLNLFQGQDDEGGES